MTEPAPIDILVGYDGPELSVEVLEKRYAEQLQFFEEEKGRGNLTKDCGETAALGSKLT
jgi:hypothetical protein